MVLCTCYGMSSTDLDRTAALGSYALARRSLVLTRPRLYQVELANNPSKVTTDSIRNQIHVINSISVRPPPLSAYTLLWYCNAGADSMLGLIMSGTAIGYRATAMLRFVRYCAFSCGGTCLSCIFVLSSTGDQPPPP